MGEASRRKKSNGGISAPQNTGLIERVFPRRRGKEKLLFKRVKLAAITTFSISFVLALMGLLVSASMKSVGFSMLEVANAGVIIAIGFAFWLIRIRYSPALRGKKI